MARPESHSDDPLTAAAASFIDRRGLLAPGQGVLVGVSGGADSVALLAVLRDLAGQPARAYRLAAAHLNHRLRPGADEDAAFVADLARRWGIPCEAGSCDVRAVAGAAGLGLEAAARRARYEFLQAAAVRFGAAAVAVGHHADDHAETVLHRIARGTHLRGLCGMPASRALGGSGLRLIRPLLESRRADVEAFCRRRGLTWRTDPTNADPAFRRNFIRHELLPALRRLNPRADEALLRLAAAAGQAEACLAEQGARLLARAVREAAAGVLALDAATLAGEHALVRAYALRGALERLHVPLGGLTAERMAELAALPAAPPPAAVTLPAGWLARREGTELVLGPNAPAPRAEGEEGAIRLAVPGLTELPDGRRVLCRKLPFRGTDFVQHCIAHAQGVELLDAEAVRGGLLWRSRRAGDAFVPLGAPGTQKVSDFLTNARLPRRRRQEVGCIADEEGIVYLAPLRIAQRVAVTDRTRDVLRIEIHGAGPDPAAGTP